MCAVGLIDGEPHRLVPIFIDQSNPSDRFLIV